VLMLKIVLLNCFKLLRRGHMHTGRWLRLSLLCISACKFYITGTVTGILYIFPSVIEPKQKLIACAYNNN
jgi:hypothetical protein